MGAEQDTSAGTNGAEAGGTPAPAAVPEDLDKRIGAAVTAALAPYAKKWNGELADLRRATKRPAGEPAAAPASEDPAPTPLTRADLDAMRELGRLEAKLDAAALAALQEDDAIKGLPLSAQAAVMRHLVAARSVTDKDRGGTPEATPNPPPARSGASAVKDPIPSVRSQAEFLELRRKDPKAAQRLLDSDDFDLSELPRVIR